MSQIDDFLSGKPAGSQPVKKSEIDAFLGAADPGIGARVKQGASRALDSARTALTDDPNKIAQIASDQARTALPQSETQRQMAQEMAPYVDAANKAQGVVENVKTWGAAGLKRAGQLLSNPGEAGKMIAEQLPNSIPGMAGGLAGAKLGAMAGTAVAPGVGTLVGGVVGGVAGGFAGRYGLEKGAAMQEQVQKEAQARGIDIQKQDQVSAMVGEKLPEFESAARRKGVGTAGTDAVLNVATMGLAGVGGRTLAKEARTLADAVKAGTISAADASATLARLEATNAARNTLGAKALRGTGVVGAEMVGEGASEAVGQKLAYDNVDAGEVIDESLMGLGSGGAMALGSKAFNKAAGVVDQDATTQTLEAVRQGVDAMGQPLDVAPGQPPAPGPTLALPAPEQGVIAVGADGTARTPAYQAPGYVGDVTDVEPKAIDPVREQVSAAAEQGGALSAAALTAIDTGVTDAMQPPVVEQPEPAPISLEEADARDQAAYEQFFAGVDSEPVVARYFENDDDIPDFDAASNVSEADFLRSLGATDEDIQDAIATSRQSVSPQGSAAVDAGTQANEPAGPREGAGADAAGQASQVAPRQPGNFSGTPVATMGQAGATARPGPGFGLKDALAQIRTRKQQEAGNAQATQEPAPAAAEAPGAAAAPAVEAAGVANDFSTAQGSPNGPQADQAQQASPQPAQAGAAPAAEPATSDAGTPATAGTPEVRALTDDAQAENTGAQAAPAAGAQGEAAASAETVPQRLKRERAEKNAAKADALPREKSKPKSVAARAKEAQAARADYFTPGNIVKGYGGYDRVVAYSPPDENGRWSVTVRAVRKDGDVWVDEPGVRGRVRVHETQPDAKELKAGPIQRAAVSSTAEASDAPANAPASTQSTTMQVDPADSGKETQPAQAETGPFGPILTQYRGDAQGAIKALTELQDGEAVAALNHPDVGDIDLVWGEEGTGNKDGFGLAKLQKFHPEVLDDLQGFLSTLAKDPKRSGKNRVRLVSEGGEAAVSLDWKGDRKVWLLTAYEKGAGDGTTMNTADVVNRDDTTRPDASASTSLPPTATAPQPIQDAGQKIGGARKDRWKERGLNLEDLDAMTESEGAELATKANVWRPDYEAMSEASEPVTAAMVKTIYDQLAAKPKKNTPEGRRQYVQMMRIVRDVLTEARGPEAVRNAYQAIRQRAGLNTIEPQAKTAARELMFSVYKGRSDPFVLGGADLMKAKKMVQDGFPAKGAPWKTRLVVGREEGGPGTTERGVEIYMARSAEVGTPLTREQILDGFYRVVTKDNKAVAFAASKADAEAAAATVYERDMKGKKDGKPEPVRPNLDELKRENMPRRIDRDVKADDFVNDLGFRGIEFGNWSAQDERQRILNMAYDGLMDLAEIMGVPPKAMSLNGTLGMAFGARGGGRFAAHYEPGKLVINMTKIRGGGSMAHEWAHAMDHYFGELDKPDAYTTQARGASGWYSEDQYMGVPRKRMEKVGNEWKNVEKMRLDNLRPEMAAAFDGVMRALFSKQITKAEMVRSHELDLERTEALARNEQQPDLKAMYQNMVQNKQQALNEMRGDPEGTMYAGRGRSEYASQAQKLSGKSTDGYWVRPTEMFARAFESWVFDRVTAMGSKSDYLVHGVEEDRFAGGAYKGNPYPTGEERARINAAFDKLASTIKTRETDKGVAMFSRSQGTKSAYESRIDALFAGDTASRMGAKVLDRSDVLGLLGYPDQPVVLAEGKVRQGQDNHQRMTAEVWKKIPEWLDNPAAAFDSDTVPGRLVLIAPELVNGAPVRMILEPNTAVGGMQVHLLVNAFDAAGRTPWMRWAADGLTRYVDKKKFPEILAPSGLQLSRVEQASRGTAKILTDKQLSGYRRANSPSFDREAQAGLSPEQAVAALYAEGPAPTADSNARLVATQMLVDGLTAQWTRAPEIIVARNMQDPKIPQRVRDYDEQLKSQGSDGEARGFIYQGKVYLLSDVLKGPEQIAEVLFHEALGHYGLRGVFGDGLKPILQQMGTMRRKDVLAKAREYGMVAKGMSDVATWAAMSERDRLSAAEEVLAEMAQTQPTIGFVQRAVAAVRTWLRANVPGFKNLALTDAEIIRSYILPARGFVTRSSETPQQSLERAMMAFSRGASGTEAALRELAAEAQAPGNANKTVVLGQVSPQQLELLQREGVPVDGGFTHAADMFAVRHALKRHGDAAVEAKQGQLPLGEADIAAVPKIIASADALILGAKTPRGQDIVGSLKRMPDGTVLYLEEVRSGRKTLAMTSMRKYPGTTDFEAIKDRIVPSYARSDTGDVRIVYPEGSPGQGQDPDDTRINFSRTTAAAKAVGDSLKSITVSNIKQRAGFKATDYLGLGLQSLGRRQIVDIYGDMLPMTEYNRLVQQMEADKNEGGAEADQLVTRWAKLPDEGKLADLMHDATLAQIDPAKPYVEGDDKARYMSLQGRFKVLSDGAQKAYIDTRDAYQSHHEKVRSAIKERIERSEIKGERKAALLKQMDDEFFKAVKGVYFPLARFGQYVVTVKGPDGKVESVSRAETMDEANSLRGSLLSAFQRDKGFTVGRVMLSKEFVAERDAVGRGFMTELYQVLDKQDMDAVQRAELEDTLGQLYLSSLPDLSWAKHGIHRKGTPGFSQDARRAYAQNMFHGARYLAKLRYSDLMQNELVAMQKHVDDWREVEGFDQPSAQRVVDEMNKRHETLMNPKSNALSTALTSFGFVFHLGLSPASAMVNLSQTALVAYPVMGAKWGYGKASAALLKASAEAAKGKNDITGSLNEDERAAYDEAVRAGTIDVTMAHDLAGIAQGEDAGVMWKIRPVMRWASFLFHHAERFNRQVTFVAAYRLAREAGTDQKAAFEQATKATYDGHFDYAAANRPRIMQGNVAKVVLLFKQYGQNMVYTLARNAQQAIKAETPEARAQARKTLGGLLATHAAAAGVLGLPMVTTLLAAASMIGGDDDEPWDAKVALQNMLADTFGQKPAEVMSRGLSRLTPWDISGRVGLDKLIFPDVQEGLEGQRLAESAMAAALGPVAGIGVNLLKGLQDMAQGQYARGLESMMPAALRGPIKSVRYEAEGVQDKTGIVVKDEVSAAGVVGQFLGFSPSEVRNATEGKSAIAQRDRALGERRQELLTKAARATMDKDAEARAEALKEIERFNEKNPGRRITAINIVQSVRNRQKRIDQAEGGVYLPRNRRDAMDAGRFANAD
ncbi:PLxRFG domain-containing protein [Acidovorax sp. RAC01]|uniref:PLxRFG domain-containing protein n=1 Tax=Acidovorax sp. RAC01 TaxID=1842533 RepID=UPI00083E797F|nr:PLxRFG domain-containing protein [Acidovorax sp. RAC01]AOG22566.1 putative phage associated protein [Acidovorax sp. RAC01]AOG24903.1 putative phage associated protein [Acidovorax sp. RAC01]